MLPGPPYPWDAPLGAVPGAHRHDHVPRVGAACARAGARPRRRPDAARARRRRRLRGRGARGARLGLRLRRRRRAAAGPVLALAAGGPARALARARRRRLRLDRRRLGAARAPRHRPLRAARRHVHARGDVRRGDPAPGGAARARRHDDRADADRRVPRRPRLGLRRRLPLRRALGLRRPARASSGSSTRRTRAGLAVVLDVVYNHLGASGVQAMEAFGPYHTAKYATPVGRGDQPRRRGLRTPCASGSSSRRSAGSATSTSTACGSTPSTRSPTPARSTSSPRSPAACTARTRARS